MKKLNKYNFESLVKLHNMFIVFAKHVNVNIIKAMKLETFKECNQRF